MPRRPDSRRLATWRLFLEAHAGLVEILERELEAERGLPLAWYDILVQLSEASGQRLRMTDLAQAVLLSKSGLTRLVDRMVRAGFVRREPCEDDRRGVYVTMTAEGAGKLRDAAPVHLRGIQEHFARHLEDGEVAVLRGALGRVVAAQVRPRAD